MKQYSRLTAATIALCLFCTSLLAQDEKRRSPAWASDRGYWVVESNIHSPLTFDIWFYNNDKTLVYKERLTGIKLNPDKKKVKMKLKKVLESSVVAWQQNHVCQENKDYVAAVLK